MDAQQLRQNARRMFTTVDADLAVRHRAMLLGRETRTAQAETYLALWDNHNGTYSGKFTIPELHGHLIKHTIDQLTAPRRHTRNRAGQPIVARYGTNIDDPAPYIVRRAA